MGKLIKKYSTNEWSPNDGSDGKTCCYNCFVHELGGGGVGQDAWDKECDLIKYPLEERPNFCPPL